LDISPFPLTEKKVDLIPPLYQLEKRAIYRWCLIGLELRFLVMPFCFHDHLFTPYAHAQALLEGNWNFFSSSFTLFTHLIHLPFLFFFNFLVPHLPKVWQYLSLHHFWEAQLCHPYIFRILFLFKLPYLLFDFGAAFLLLRFFSRKETGLKIFKFWLINPVSLYLVYIYSRFETIGLFFVLLSLYYLKVKQILKATIWLVLSILTRFYTFLFLPFYLFLAKTACQRIKMISIFLVPLLFLEVIKNIKTLFQTGFFDFLKKLIFFNWADFKYLTQPVAEWMEKSFVGYLLSCRLFLNFHDTIFFFVVGYMLILFHFIHLKERNFFVLLKHLFYLLAFLFAVCFFHPQYFMWLMPFLFLLGAREEKLFKYYLIIIFCFFFYLLQWGPSMIFWLFAPLWPEYFLFKTPNPFEVVSRYFPTDDLIGIFRSIFSATLLWMGYLVYKLHEKPKEI
jgi:hypothetical protein